MNLSDLKFKARYYLPYDDALNDFIIPALKCASRYDRAAGYFSSDSLIYTSAGMCSIAQRGGKIRLLTSPVLRREDVDAIIEGHERRKVVEESLLRCLAPSDLFQKEERLNLLANLIGSGQLDIKVAVMRDLEGGMFHPKFGIIYDLTGCILSFAGSANESINGYYRNIEQLCVSSLRTSRETVDCDVERFNKLWDNTDEYAEVLDLPDAVKQELIKFKTGEVNFDLDYDLTVKKCKEKPSSPSVFFKSTKPGRDYQNEAVSQWEKNGYCGLFNMATGTGKTITALMSLERLYNNAGGAIFTIIICPQRHLVDQWADSVRDFGVNPIVGYSDSPDKNWEEELRKSVLLFNAKKTNKCFITTMNSFSLEKIQKQIEKIVGNIALVVDEVHNMGSPSKLSALPSKIQYRLGLSATIERYNDPVGTTALRNYFGEECIYFPLEKAIGTALTEYHYYPVFCTMSNEEYLEFVSINGEIEKISSDKQLSNKQKESKIRPLRVAGSRLISKLDSKYEKLKEICARYMDKPYTLVYCGKAKWDGDKLDDEDEDHYYRLVDRAVSILGDNGLGIPLATFTCEESPKDRREIKEEFLQKRTKMLVAISCLDEGIDLPPIRTAIITSSSDNPKEYVQRRGRVLRPSDGKKFAEIYDLVAIPQSLASSNADGANTVLEMKLLVKEAKRVNEFSRLSSNKNETIDQLSKIEKSYNISIDDMINRYEEGEFDD